MKLCQTTTGNALASAVAMAIVCLGANAQAAPSRGAAPRASDALTVCLVPLGKYDKHHLAHAARGIRYLYGFSVTTLPARAMPSSAYYKPRKRYRADNILDYLVDKVIPDHDECFAMIGFTRHDISTTKGKHKDWGVLGLGLLGGPAAVVSTYRVKRGAGRRTQAMRTVKVVNHELGHVLGLDHYDDEPGCVMNDAQGTVKTVDREVGLLCRPSRAYIEETHGVALPQHARFDWTRVLTR